MEQATQYDALAELARLEAEHEQLERAVRSAIRQLRTEPGTEGAVAQLEAALVFRVGDTIEDTARKLAELQATG